MSPPMQRTARTHRLRVLLACALAAAVTSCATSAPYRETSGRRGWHPFLRPAQRSPDRQLAYAGRLFAAGQTRAAMRQYRALIVRWPESPESATAQYQYAEHLYRTKDYEAAFDEYQKLFDRHAGFFPYLETLDRQFEIATHLMRTRKGRFLFLPGFAAPERAVPRFEKILANGPRWDRAAESQYLIGRAHEMALQYEEAIEAYMTTQQKHPESPFAEQASFGAAQCYFWLADENPSNDNIIESAWGALTLFLNKYPKSEHARVAAEYRQTVYRHRARLAYERAYFYDRVAHKPQAALLEYRALVGQFPHSDWTGLAQIRIEALAKIVETSP